MYAMYALYNPLCNFSLAEHSASRPLKAGSALAELNRMICSVLQERNARFKCSPRAAAEWLHRMEGDGDLDRCARPRGLWIPHIECRYVQLLVVPPVDGGRVLLKQQHGQNAAGLIKPE
jgi:hypothetical protein